jgi:hypothetical protein
VSVFKVAGWVPVTEEMQQELTSDATTDIIADIIAEWFALEAIGPPHGPPAPARRPQLAHVTGRPAGTYRRGAA